MPSRAAPLTLLLPLCLVAEAAGQAYKLEAGKELKPRASLTVKGATLSRTRVSDDPGFRLQYRFTRDGKELATLDARAQPSAELPRKEPGKYAVVLEAFHPTYKPGKQQRGRFRPISNTLSYRVEPGPNPGEPGKVVDVVSVPLEGKPALVIRCGKSKGQDQLVAKGFGYKLLRGQPAEGGPAGEGLAHRWEDAKEVRFELNVPAGSVGTLRLQFAEAEGRKGRLRIVVQGKSRGEVEGFGGRGKTLEVALEAAEMSAGRIEVAVQNLNPTGTAAVSTVEYVPAPGRP